MAVFCRNRKIYSKIHGISRHPQIVKNCEKEKQTHKTCTSWFLKHIYKATAIKTVWNCHRDKYSNISEINSIEYNGQMFFNKCTNTTQWRKNSLFPYGVGKVDTHMEKNEVGPLYHMLVRFSRETDQ